MTIVNEQMNAAKPPPPSNPELKSGKLAPGQINNSKDLDVETKKEEPGFFGSFFPAIKSKQKKIGPVMEAVSLLVQRTSDCSVLIPNASAARCH